MLKKLLLIISLGTLSLTSTETLAYYLWIKNTGTSGLTVLVGSNKVDIPIGKMNPNPIEISGATKCVSVKFTRIIKNYPSVTCPLYTFASSTIYGYANVSNSNNLTACNDLYKGVQALMGGSASEGC